ncbi:MAG: nucleotidyltransferase domain-containing protein [Sulfurimonas sp.]|uniref:nucleotidyltransferase family protein n=1 Tax=Sulfurimonas sp. TaxID=2022749 RepID=UPI002637B1B6|nr:nucleotidyltransferase domain-containing protein [Sulfurimonas sp.]MDD2652919.1 nucleotidyltransferase domain-containing protein [Sulfurimonas sp.]MDD3452365.1 nucleotidyltransferase domain-containing protein [Sulfurimonas sp.]
MNITNTVETLSKYKNIYAKEGFNIVGIFGSCARGSDNKFSDIDLAYSLEYQKFSQKYQDGFSKLLRIEDIKNELEKVFQRKVDLVSLNSSNKELIEHIKKELIYV